MIVLSLTKKLTAHSLEHYKILALLTGNKARNVFNIVGHYLHIFCVH